MAKKTLAQEAKRNVVGAAKSGAAEARNITGEALGAAAAAAAEVVLSRIAQALGSGSQSIAWAKAAPPRLKGAVSKSISGARPTSGAQATGEEVGYEEKACRSKKVTKDESCEESRETPIPLRFIRRRIPTRPALYGGTERRAHQPSSSGQLRLADRHDIFPG
jgi:hypothetical protein